MIITILKLTGVTAAGAVFFWILNDFIVNRAQKAVLSFIIGILIVFLASSFSFPLLMIKENLIDSQIALSLWIGITGAWLGFIAKVMSS